MTKYDLICDNCESESKITILHTFEELGELYCPVCGTPNSIEDEE